ncbi:unnamed protein product, partial [Mesorhabditis spiculigera]
MILLLLGFITPAVVFLILGIIACVRRSSYSPTDEEPKAVEEFTQLLTNRVPSHPPDVGYADYRYGYQNHHFQSYFLPPSYSETLALDKSEPGNDVCNGSRSKHLPARQPRILVTAATPNQGDFFC